MQVHDRHVAVDEYALDVCLERRVREHRFQHDDSRIAAVENIRVVLDVVIGDMGFERLANLALVLEQVDEVGDDGAIAFRERIVVDVVSPLRKMYSDPNFSLSIVGAASAAICFWPGLVKTNRG